MAFHRETMKFKNPTEHTINLDSIGLEPVAPGDLTDVPLELCAPNRRDNGSRGPSAIECAAPQLHPASEEDLAAWRKAPPAPTPISKIVSVAMPPMKTEAPGVKALREQREKAIRDAQEKAKTQAEKATE